MITREGDKLYGPAKGQFWFDLFAESQTKFYLKVVDVKVSFVKNEKGEIVNSFFTKTGGMYRENGYHSEVVN
ncbi:hypothetical protein [Spirosoma agri]|uniref:hypothetical protein n=1 Tax=Spirosoma agri TaxID=1987381 RepID=UPI001BB06C61|nr:hypothetical protein [Spirosoma agri]